MRRHGRPLALIAILAAPSPLVLPRGGRTASAASSRQLHTVARDHHRRGESLYVAERYAEALAEFEAGYAAMPLPGFLVNIGQCHRRLGDLAAARAAFERFLALAPDSPLAPEVGGLVRDLMLTPPPLATGVGPATAPAVERDPVPEPSATASAPAPGNPVVAEPVVAHASLAAVAEPVAPEAVSLALTPDPSPAPKAADHRRHAGTSMWLWGGVAVAAAALVSAAVVIGSSGGGTTMVHDGTLGTLRR